MRQQQTNTQPRMFVRFRAKPGIQKESEEAPSGASNDSQRHPEQETRVRPLLSRLLLRHVDAMLMSGFVMPCLNLCSDDNVAEANTTDELQVGSKNDDGRQSTRSGDAAANATIASQQERRDTREKAKKILLLLDMKEQRKRECYPSKCAGYSSECMLTLLHRSFP